MARVVEHCKSFLVSKKLTYYMKSLKLGSRAMPESGFILATKRLLKELYFLEQMTDQGTIHIPLLVGECSYIDYRQDVLLGSQYSSI